MLWTNSTKVNRQVQELQAAGNYESSNSCDHLWQSKGWVVPFYPIYGNECNNNTSISSLYGHIPVILMHGKNLTQNRTNRKQKYKEILLSIQLSARSKWMCLKNNLPWNGTPLNCLQFPVNKVTKRLILLPLQSETALICDFDSFEAERISFNLFSLGSFQVLFVSYFVSVAVNCGCVRLIRTEKVTVTEYTCVDLVRDLIGKRFDSWTS